LGKLTSTPRFLITRAGAASAPETTSNKPGIESLTFSTTSFASCEWASVDSWTADCGPPERWVEAEATVMTLGREGSSSFLGGAGIFLFDLKLSGVNGMLCSVSDSTGGSGIFTSRVSLLVFMVSLVSGRPGAMVISSSLIGSALEASLL